MNTALIVVDVQNDFCENGAMGVDGGNDVALAIADYVEGDLADARGFDYVVATRDAHVDPGSHFSDDPDFVESWPKHCVAGTGGAQLHPALAHVTFDAIFDKGAHDAAYSGFEGFSEGVGLNEWLTERGVGRVEIVGIATDYCVRATAKDAHELGYHTTVNVGLCAAVDPDRVPRVVDELNDLGILTIR